jgi:hypothetical protein
VLIGIIWLVALSRWLVTDTVVPWDSKNQFYAFFRFLAAVLQAGAVARIVRWRPDRIAIETSADRSGVLDLHMTAYPGWIAELDGREVPLTRAPPLFMAVKVPAGRHHFVLRYAPFSLANLTDALRRAAGWQPDTDISSSRPPPAAAFTLH